VIKLPLSKNKYALVDDEDYPKVSKHKWFVIQRGKSEHACRTVIENGNKRTEYLHRALLNPNSNEVVDHINGNGLDNQKANLRLCTKQQNSWNSDKNTKNVSGYKGVSFEKTTGKWRVRIRKDGKSYSYGLYEQAEEASKVYLEKAQELFGQYARI
jgi:hypothetical protein